MIKNHQKIPDFFQKFSKFLENFSEFFWTPENQCFTTETAVFFDFLKKSIFVKSGKFSRKMPFTPRNGAETPMCKMCNTRFKKYKFLSFFINFCHT